MNFQDLIQKITPWIITHGVKIVSVLIIAYIAIQIGKIFISRLIRSLVKIKDGLVGERTEREREKTLISVFYSTFRLVVWVIAILTILPEFGINIGGLLAGVGIIGLAIGLGARSLVQDYLAGLFIILEDQYRVSEEIKIVGIQGKVKNLNLRRTILVDGDGIVHSVPNGKIAAVSNFSRSKS